MSKTHTFKAIIENAGGGGAFVSIPFDVEEAFGKKRVKVLATIEGVPYRGSIMRMGSPCHMLGVLKNIREQIGKSFGDEVTVTVKEDTDPRIASVPDDLAAAIAANPNAATFFATLAFTHQKEYAKWIEDAKRPETRAARIAKAVQMLVDGKKER
jgi:hypothetical protein